MHLVCVLLMSLPLWVVPDASVSWGSCVAAVC